jgi:hypothetical protein
MHEEVKLVHSLDLDELMKIYGEKLKTRFCTIRIEDIEKILIRKYPKGYLNTIMENGNDRWECDWDEYIELEQYHKGGVIRCVDDLWKLSNCGRKSDRVTRSDLENNPSLEYMPFVIFDIRKALQVGSSITSTSYIEYPLDSKFLTIQEKVKEVCSGVCSS